MLIQALNSMDFQLQMYTKYDSVYTYMFVYKQKKYFLKYIYENQFPVCKILKNVKKMEC